MFTTKRGAPVGPRNFDRSWRSRVTRAGVPPITAHDGWRTCGSLLARSRRPSASGDAILRHTQFAITMEIYTKVSDAATTPA